jgi:hypothetical protein
VVVGEDSRFARHRLSGHVRYSDWLAKNAKTAGRPSRAWPLGSPSQSVNATFAGELLGLHSRKAVKSNDRRESAKPGLSLYGAATASSSQRGSTVRKLARAAGASQLPLRSQSTRA